MTKFELWVARWLARRVVKNGYATSKLTALFSIILAEAQAEFTEDNEPTLHYFMRECLDSALNKGTKYP